MADEKEVKKYCSGIDCLTCDETEPCIYRIANRLQEQLKRKEEECEELHNRTASIIYNLTGGRLSYSTYTLEACEQAYRDQLSIDVERATKELEEELQAQRNFTAQEQRKIYCVAYDKTCETDNECKQKKCVFKDRLKYKQALDEIEKYLDVQQKYFDGEDYHNLLDIINKVKDSK